MNVWAWEMGKPLKIEHIGDMFQLLWLESVITEASLMTRNIKLPSVFMNLDVFPLQVWGGFAPPAKNRRVWGAAPPSETLTKKFTGGTYAINLLIGYKI